MPTYAQYGAERERATRRAAQDRHLAAVQSYCEATAGEVRMKYERPSFAVVTASAAFREGYERIFGARP